MKLKTTGKLMLGAGMVALMTGRLAAKAYGLYKRTERGASYSFQNRVVLITGGSRGLGLVLARQLVAQGARVAILARDARELERAAADLIRRGGTVLAMQGDVGNLSEATAAVRETVKHFGQLDVLINNAGIIQTGPFVHMDLEDFEQSLAVHFWGPLYTIQAALPHLKGQPEARIVNIASIGGKLSIPHLLPYCASKFALVGLSSGLRSALKSEGVSVTTVCPGLMRTGSHLNALFKGKHEQEFFWFSLSDSLPLVTVTAPEAARQILRACRRGDAELVIGLPYRIAARLAPLFPRLTAQALALLNRLLPKPTGIEGDISLPGWASRSLTPPLLTFLADLAARQNNELPRPA